MSTLDELRAELTGLRVAGLARRLREVSSPQGPEIELDGRRVLNACSNDYLGLASHPAVVAAAKEALDRFGNGAGAARLIVGNSTPHARLEAAVRRFLSIVPPVGSRGSAAATRGPAALLFSSGFHANLSALAVLAGEGGLIVSDALNHASLIDGCRLARAKVVVTPHGDARAIAEVLARSRARRKVVVTESLFSMDGDLAPLDALFDAARLHGAILYVDEAHAIGVLGPDGRGGSAASGLPEDDPNLVRMGTFGKAFGSYGAFIAAAPEIVELLTSRARGFIFTTALPPSAAAAAEAAIALSRAEPGRRERLRAAAARLRGALEVQGWSLGPARAQIVPVMLHDAGATMEASARLLEQGIYCQGIRPPTVAPGTCRLRLSITADFDEARIDRIATAFSALRPMARAVGG